MYKPSEGTSKDKFQDMMIGNPIGKMVGSMVLEGMSDRDPTLM